MSTEPDRKYAALLERAWSKLEELEGELHRERRRGREPIAVIGMGCRFPGRANGPDALWRLLDGGHDPVTEIPADRWDVDALYDPDPDAAGKTYARWGAFLDQVDQFDPAFFGIAPREALAMDPQQRILLEVAWEALEDAGYAGADLAGSNVGVYVGMVAVDWAHLRRDDLSAIDTYFGTGISRSIAAGRLSYLLGLEGPSMAVDTACSSSLVSVHLACQALRSGETDMALAGGVNLILAPDGSISIARARMASFTGRCRAFDAGADGYVRAEGCGLVLLKRLSEAVKDGDHIYGTILGSATNQDGRSNGITAPSGRAQERVIRAALADAGVDASEVGLLEAHGTGTPLGDPIEVGALTNVFAGARTKANPLLLGSVKTNLGHTEASAGIASLLKVLLSLKHGRIPPHLHLVEPNPRIPWNESPFRIPTTSTPWDAPADGRRVAGVSSFGFSGTNAHVIVADPPRREGAAEATSGERPHHLMAMSARDGTALDETVGRVIGALRAGEASLPDIAWTLNVGRAALGERLAVVAANGPEASERLEAWSRGDPVAGVLRGQAGGDPPEVAFLFTGQGAQRAGMGRELYESLPVFREALDRCADAVAGALEVDLREVLYGPPGAAGAGGERIHQTAYTQPALFAVEYALSEVWRSWGVEPAVVMGHSVGEYVAAVVAGVMDVESGMRLVTERGRLMGALPTGGGMAAVFAAEDVVLEALEQTGATQTSVAAVNGPENVVVSGPDEEVEALVARMEEAGVRAKRLQVSHAFHSALMDPVLEAFEERAKGVEFREARVGLVSNLTGMRGGRELGTAAYWRDHLRRPVRFLESMRTLESMGVGAYLEIGPGPTLLGMGRGCVEPAEGVWVPSLRPGRGEWEQMLESLGRLWVSGVEVDWKGYDAPHPRRRVPLPTYPFQRERYWLTSSGTPPVARAPGVHPLLGSRLESPALADVVFETAVGVNHPAFLNDHRIFDVPILPATGFIEMAVAAGREALGFPSPALAEITIQDALVLPETGTMTLHTVLHQDALPGARFEIFSRSPEDASGDGERWRLHASGRLVDGSGTTGAPLDPHSLGERLPEELGVRDYYARLSGAGVDYGPAFRVLRDIRRRDGEALARLQLPPGEEAGAGDYLLHPGLLDGCIQLLGAALPQERADAGSDAVYVPVGIGEYEIRAGGHGALWCRARLEEGSGGSEVLRGDVELHDAAGAYVGALRKVGLRRVQQDTVRRLARETQKQDTSTWFHRIEWEPAPIGKPVSGEDAPGSWLILGDRGGAAGTLAEALESRGHRATVLEARGAGMGELERIRAALDAVGRDAGFPYRGAVHLRALDRATGNEAAGFPMDRHRAVCGSALDLVQALDLTRAIDAPVWFVTRGVRAVGPTEPVRDDALARETLGQASLPGFVNTVQLEHPELQAVSVDLDPDLDPDPESWLAALLAELPRPDDEDQIAWRKGVRTAARLVPHEPDAPNLRTAGTGAYEIRIGERGTLDGLVVATVPAEAPGPGEVAIQVRASALNFRDVLNLLAMYPGDAGPIGSEAAGIVTAVGEGVRDLLVGDEVMAMAPGAFRSHMIASAGAVHRTPEGFTLAEAATLPIAFLTAWYGLHNLARIREGERVLVHAAAGGVGMAAVQIALDAGAIVFGTAGSPEKRAFLRAAGVHHVLDSRSLSFADEIPALTDGQGVDIVLNSLADDFIPRSLGVLSDGGRFLEIGKRGVWTEDEVAALNPTLEYYLYDLGVELQKAPDLAAEMFAELMPRFDSGRLRPLPSTTFPVARTDQAFRFMAQARHIGKILVEHGGGVDSPPIRSDATYLVTGGLGGIGLVVARGLVERGARHLLLMGRSEPSGPASATLEELRSSGARVEVIRGDVSRLADVEAAVRRTEGPLPPLAGVFHLAGVIDDGLLGQQSWNRFETVAAPKMGGAWNLHRATEGRPLDLFVLASTGSAVVGSVGQGNYSAANAFLDALAHLRHARGLPALSVNWGGWAEVGMAARLGERDRARWRDLGIGLIDPQQGWEALLRLMAGRSAQVAVLPFDWRRYLSNDVAAGRPVFRRLLAASGRGARSPGRRATSVGAGEFREAFERTDPLERKDLLESHVRRVIARVMGLDDHVQMDARRGLSEMGMDSLMAVELSNHLQASLGVDLPPTLAFEHPTIGHLMAHLWTTIGPSEHPPETAVPEPEPAASDAERQLLEELRRAGF